MIYHNKISKAPNSKLRNFNMKMLNKRLATQIFLHKIKEAKDNNCSTCLSPEDDIHMLFSCQNVLPIWQMVSNILNIQITFKLLFTGYYEDLNTKLDFYNIIINQILHSIYMVNNYYKRKEAKTTTTLFKCRIISDLKLLTLCIKDDSKVESINKFISEFIL